MSSRELLKIRPTFETTTITFIVKINVNKSFQLSVVRKYEKILSNSRELIKEQVWYEIKIKCYGHCKQITN